MPTSVMSSPSRATRPGRSRGRGRRLGDVAALAVEVLVLDEDHRVVVADRRLEQALGVARGRGTATSRPGTWR